MERHPEEVKEILEKYLADINTIVTSKIGIKTRIEINELTDYRNDKYYALQDTRNLKKVCGIMESAFSMVTIHGNVYESEDGIDINFQFRYDHITGGSNGADFCHIGINKDDGFVKLHL